MRQRYLLPHRIGDLENFQNLEAVDDFLPHRIGDLEKMDVVHCRTFKLPHRIGDLEIDCID